MKKTIAVPSLSRLSQSSKTARGLGTPIFLKIATTAIGSVADISAPNTRACFQVKPCAKLSALATGVKIKAVNT
jgi:hypothetical protein